MEWNLFWTAFGAIGGTFGAVATFAAVVVALWQTKNSYKKKLQLSFTDDITVHLTLFNATISVGEPKLLEHNDMKWITVSEPSEYEFCLADEEIIRLLQFKYQSQGSSI